MGDEGEAPKWIDGIPARVAYGWIDLFMDGKYQLKEMVTRRLPLSQLNHVFDLMKQGEVKRSVIVYE